MSRRRSAFDLTLPRRNPGIAAYRWLYTVLRSAILEGRLRPGARLPGTRDLSRQYGLSRGTIVSAFELLQSEGYTRGTVGSGTYVNHTLPEELLQVPATVRSRPSAQAGHTLRLSDYAHRVKAYSGTEVRPSPAFRANIPAVDLFPTALWAQMTARRLRRAPVSLFMGCDPLGYLPLRKAVADYLNTFRGVQCVADNVVIVSGVQEALDLAARLLLNPGDRAAIENPGYPGAARVFAATGATVVPIAVDEEGLVVRAAQLRGCRLVYVTPGHQFPMGMTMSLPRRLALIDWARTTGALVLEDDYDSEFRYSGPPVPALQGLDRSGQVLFVTSFNKILFPSLRLGCLVVPPGLVDRVSAAKSLTSRHRPLLEQAVVCDFIADGHLGRHLRRMREVYAERLSVLLEAARARLDGLLKVATVQAGIQTVGSLQGVSADRATAAAARRGVEVLPVNHYAQGRAGRNELLLGFAAIRPEDIRRGVRELAIALESQA